MNAKAIIIWLIVGAVAGWLAGMVVKGGGYGLIGNIIVGIVGGLIAGWLLPHIGVVIAGGVIGSIINAFTIWRARSGLDLHMALTARSHASFPS